MKKKIICLPTYPNFSDRVGSGETKIFLNLAQAATKSEKSNLHMKNAQAARLQQTMSRKVAATKSSKTNLHTKNSQAATMPQLAAAAKPHACCLFAAIHCEKPFISIRVVCIYQLSVHRLQQFL